MDLEAGGGRLVIRHLIQCTGDIPGYPGPHEHTVYPRQHGSIQGGQIRHLDLRQKIDAYGSVMTLFGEVDLHEVGDNGQLIADLVHHLLVHGDNWVGNAFGPTFGLEVAAQYLRRYLGNGELGQSPSQVTSDITVLETPYEHGIQAGAGDHTQLAIHGHGTGQGPIGNPYCHTALNDRRESNRRRHFN